MIIPIESWDDPRLTPFHNIKDRTLARDRGMFIAEGEQVVLRLLAGSFADVRLLLAENRLPRWTLRIPEGVECFVAPELLVKQVTGFDFHRGVIACARRPVLSRPDELSSPGEVPQTLVICAGIQDAENLGLILRCAAALGVDGVLLGERTADPFYRRVVRVSMGAVFQLRIAVSENLPQDLSRLADAGTVLLATVLDPEAVPLDRIAIPQRVALVFGNENCGLPSHLITHCHHRVTIPMKKGIDSLNVAAAAAIIIHHFTRHER